jgi:hypothetical protein
MPRNARPRRHHIRREAYRDLPAILLWRLSLDDYTAVPGGASRLLSRTLHQVICRCGAAGPERASPAAAAAAWDVPLRNPHATVRQATAAMALPGAG